MLGRAVEKVALGADGALKGHDDALANRIDRRVGDLREQLLEVVEDEAGSGREAGEGRVVAHGAERFGTFDGHRPDEHLEGLAGVAEAAKALHEVVDRRAGVAALVGDAGLVGESDLVVADPLSVGEAGGHFVLDFLVFHDLLLLEVDQKHLTRLEAALGEHILRRNIEDADFGPEDHAVVLGDVEAAGAEAVAVEGGTDALAVGERHEGWPVPRLHEAGVVFVEGLLLGSDANVVLPGFGNHHHHRLGDRTAAEGQELEQVVELAGVGGVFVHDRVERLEFFLGADGGAAHNTLAGLHPVDVSTACVDFSVVSKHSERLCTLPRGESVGGETRVD
mmetsp:Transcript_20988/g.37387  ORF Transcript_20988/g.37387 Transcript_20988/m.37387 type:complete len:336 (+) Transcript_20988:5119-6126(+)